jgi:hypothetical protein
MENEGKKTTEKRKVRIAVATSLAVGVVIGGTVIYIMNGDSIKLGRLLKEYGKNKEGKTLIDCLTEYAKNSNHFVHTTPTDDTVTMANLVEGAKTLIESAEENGHIDEPVTALIAFTKNTK